MDVGHIPNQVTSIAYILNLIQTKNFTKEIAAQLLDACEGVGNPPAHPRQHVFATNSKGFPMPLAPQYERRLRHSMFQTKDDQNEVTYYILNSLYGKKILENLQNNGVGWRIVIFAPCGSLKLSMIELEKGEFKGRKFQPQNFTLVLDHLQGGDIRIQTDYPTEEVPQIVTQNLVKNLWVFQVKRIQEQHGQYYYLDLQGRVYKLNPLPGGQQLVPYTKSKSLSTGFPITQTGLNYALSNEPIFLNGMKVIFDQPVGVYPVTLEPKDKEHSNGTHN
jgi:hypothetical protein